MTDAQIIEEVDKAMKLGAKQALVEVRAEIEESRYGLINDGLDVALKIIDKHISELKPN